MPVKTPLLRPLKRCWQQHNFKYIRLYKLPLIRLKRRYMAFKSHPKSHPYINPEFSGISAEKRKNILVYMSLSWGVERGRFRAFISLKGIQNISLNIYGFFSIFFFDLLPLPLHRHTHFIKKLNSCNIQYSSFWNV